jgi:transposase
MQRRIFSREYKLEAVKLVKERGVAVAQAARDLDVHENVLRKWVREYGSDPAQSFPGKGQMKPEQLEIERLRREVAKLKAERDILKKAAVGSTGQRNIFGEFISGRSKAKCLARSRIQPHRDRVQISLAIT